MLNLLKISHCEWAVHLAPQSAFAISLIHLRKYSHIWRRNINKTRVNDPHNQTYSSEIFWLCYCFHSRSADIHGPTALEQRPVRRRVSVNMNTKGWKLPEHFLTSSTFLRLPESKLDEKTYSSHSKSLILTGKGSTGRRDLVPVGRARLHWSPCASEGWIPSLPGTDWGSNWLECSRKKLA